MLRFIIKRRYKDRYNGLETEGFETIDIDVPELEQTLTSGGVGEDCYDVRDLAGIEVLPAKH